MKALDLYRLAERAEAIYNKIADVRYIDCHEVYLAGENAAVLEVLRCLIDSLRALTVQKELKEDSKKKLITEFLVLRDGESLEERLRLTGNKVNEIIIILDNLKRKNGLT